MSKIFRTWVYHATLAPKIITSDKFEDYKNVGWSDTPATFAKIVDFGVDETDPSAVQVLGEAISGVAERLNGELNIGKMDKQQLEDYALKHFNVDIDRRRGIRALRLQVTKLIEN
jgi:hypothetical protein